MKKLFKLWLTAIMGVFALTGLTFALVSGPMSAKSNGAKTETITARQMVAADLGDQAAGLTVATSLNIPLEEFMTYGTTGAESAPFIGITVQNMPEGKLIDDPTGDEELYDYGWKVTYTVNDGSSEKPIYDPDDEAWLASVFDSCIAVNMSSVFTVMTNDGVFSAKSDLSKVVVKFYVYNKVDENGTYTEDDQLFTPVSLTINLTADEPDADTTLVAKRNNQVLENGMLYKVSDLEADNIVTFAYTGIELGTTAADNRIALAYAKYDKEAESYTYTDTVYATEVEGAYHTSVY